ncbi:MAG TPA: tRNA lysidine(34) synthetase TilS [Methylomirabilota bacterium]|nr:tRNA lysidine(34) synthetase TilS [Methylomirabilota bacterium]
MKHKLPHRVLAALRISGKLHPGNTLGVGVSGGADSVALLRLLLEIRESLGVRLIVLHFNHHIRGAESNSDEEFVRALATAHGLELVAGGADVPDAAQRNGWNLEDAARRLRYDFFDRTVRGGRAARVAVAHTADDQAETVLAHIFRGTGLTGLSGIYPETGSVVRPLLAVRRRELREYLAGLGQDWREDSSNQDASRFRARIRHGLLPMLEQEFQPVIVEQLCRLSSLARREEEFWNQIVSFVFHSVTAGEPERGISISIKDLLDPLRLGDAKGEGIASPDALSCRLVRRIYEELRGSRQQLTARHVEQVIHLATASTSGAETHLPGARVERDFNRLQFSRYSPSLQARPGRAARPARSYAYPVELGERSPAEVVVPEIERRVRLKVIDWSRFARETTGGQVALDLDRLQSPLVLRSWLPGDSFRLPGRHRVRKLKRLLLESRIPLRDRAGWPVLTSGGVLVWVRGFPVASEFAAAADTRQGVIIEEEPL